MKFLAPFPAAERQHSPQHHPEPCLAPLSPHSDTRGAVMVRNTINTQTTSQPPRFLSLGLGLDLHVAVEVRAEWRPALLHRKQRGSIIMTG